MGLKKKKEKENQLVIGAHVFSCIQVVSRKTLRVLNMPRVNSLKDLSPANSR